MQGFRRKIIGREGHVLFSPGFQDDGVRRQIANEDNADYNLRILFSFRTPAKAIAMKHQESLFGRHRVKQQAEMDMTPMVDVTFLLLIFFMVTASFAMQKSLEFPSPDQKDDTAQNRTIEDIENRDDYIIVRIDGDNAYHVDDRETFSRQELLSILRGIQDADTGVLRAPLNLLIIADNTASHEAVVSAIDVGNAAGITRIKYTTVDE